MIASLEHVTVARGGKPVLSDISFSLNAGDRVFIGGENGAGKSSLLLLLAGRLHPYNNAGTRRYAWDGLQGEDFRQSRKHIALVSREEQNRLLGIHRHSSVREFLTGHLEGQDFLYRDSLPTDDERMGRLIEKFGLTHLAERHLKTLSLGEMRLCLIARADLFARKLYLLDEVFSSLSAAVAGRVAEWITRLPPEAAVVLTGHDADRMADFSYTGRYMVRDGQIFRSEAEKPASKKASSTTTVASHIVNESVLIECKDADFYHDFTRIFAKLSFGLHTGDRVLLTGPNGSGKTTLLRIMHGDFYPAWQQGSLTFLGTLAHEQKAELWARAQFMAAAHFTYYPAGMTVREVLASRYSGSIYSYDETLPVEANGVLESFNLAAFLSRRFADLSEGEKTRVLIARAFLKAAPLYLIDEGFIALSERYFAAAVGYLNTLRAEATIVIAANERVGELKRQLSFSLAEWRLGSGRLTTHL